MLLLVQTYGLSHVCANTEFENIDDWSSANQTSFYDPTFNFPYLDIYLSREIFSYFLDREQFHIKFYLRGTKDQELKFQNLFEFMLFTNLHGIGLINFLISVWFEPQINYLFTEGEIC